ncbi:MAG: helix-turn-helix transcriptional regulator [Chitinophagales bacterium]
MKINISIIKGILKSLQNNGYDVSKYSFLDIEDLNIPKKANEQLVDALLLFRLISEIRKEYPTSEQFYPLFRNMHVLDMGLLGHYLLTCKNIFTSYEKLIEYQLLFSNFIEFKYKRVQDEIKWSVQMPYQVYGDKYNMESLSDFELFFRLRIVETLSSNIIYPNRLELFYNNNNSKERLDFFKRQFKCDVVYTKYYNVMYYNANDLNQSIHYQNYELYKNMVPVLKKNMSSLYENKTYNSTIRSILLNNIENFPLSIEFVARKLHMSVRKLQSILKEENTSFSEIVSEVIVILGIEYMNRGKKIKEVAMRLGYKEQGSFTRIFKQVTQLNPAEYMGLDNEQKRQLLLKYSGSDYTNLI